MRLLRQASEKDDLLGTGLLRKKGKQLLSLFYLHALGESSDRGIRKPGKAKWRMRRRDLETMEGNITERQAFILSTLHFKTMRQCNNRDNGR